MKSKKHKPNIIDKILSRKLKILFFGRIDPIKNIECLIKAIYVSNANMEVRIIGSGTEEYIQKIQTMIDNLSLSETIKILPPIAMDDIKKKIKTYDWCDVFVIPSKREGMPQSVIEAMARGKIVLGAECPGICELVEDGYNGYIFPQNDCKALSKLIEQAYKAKLGIVWWEDK